MCIGRRTRFYPKNGGMEYTFDLQSIIDANLYDFSKLRTSPATEQKVAYLMPRKDSSTNVAANSTN